MTDDESQLLIRARSGGQEFAAFYRHFERAVLGFFVSATGRGDLAGDLAAETFARALEAVTAFDPARGSADQWLFGIARNVLAESYRRGRVEASARARLGMPVLVLDDHTAETIARLGSGDGHAWLALASLPNEQRQAIEARVLDEREYPDIAHELLLLGGSCAPASQPRPSSGPHTTGRSTVTILPQLERDLFNAAEERLRPDSTAPNRRPGSPASSFRPRLGRGAGALPVILSVAVAMAVAVVAVAVLGHGHRASQGTTASGPSGGSSRAELIRALGVLRRPQTKADLQGLERLDREVRASLKALPHIGPLFTQWGYHQLDRRLARVVNVHLPAFGAKVLIAPIRSEPSPTSGQRLESVHVAMWRTGNGFAFPGSRIFDDGPGHNGDAPTSVGALLAHGLGAGNVVPGLTNPMDGTVRGPDVQDSVPLVPDGVASVRLGRFTLWPGELAGFSTKALNAALATLQRTATVHDNIAAFQLAIPVLNDRSYHWTGPGPAPRSYLNAFGANVQNTWFDASGHVIKRTTTEIGVTMRFQVAHAANH